MIRVLHVLGGMGRGGVETWLAQIAGRIDRNRLTFDIATTTPGPHARADDLAAASVRLDYLAPQGRPVALAAALRRLLCERGPYGAVHCHFLGYSGWVLRTAAAAGVPIRIAHAHTTRSGSARTGLRARFRKLPQLAGRHWIRRHATHGLAVSPEAASYLYGADWRRDARFEVLRYGLDYTPFAALPPLAAARQALGIPPERRVVGHVGRMVAVKNHAFVVAVFDAVIRAGVDAHLLLVGDGPLRGEIERSLGDRGLTARATLTGERAAVAPLLAAMDLMLFPSHYEGTPLAVLEAQAAGVPILASTAVPPDIGVVGGMLERMPLETSAADWAKRVVRRLDAGRYDPQRTSRELAASEFGIDRCLARLTEVYEAR